MKIINKIKLAGLGLLATLSPGFVFAQCQQTISVVAGSGAQTYTSSGGNAAYTQSYLLVDATGTIVAISATGTFAAAEFATAGTNYTVHALNYDPANAPAPLPAVGMMASAIGSVTAGCKNLDYADDYICVKVIDCVDVCSGSTITASSSGSAAGYNQTYLLVNAAGNVIAIDNGATASFSTTGLAVGTYTVHALNWNPGDAPVPAPAVGSPASGIGAGGGCFNTDFATDYICFTILPSLSAGTGGVFAAVCPATSFDAGALLASTSADPGGVWSPVGVVNAAGVVSIPPGAAGTSINVTYTQNAGTICEDIASFSITVPVCSGDVTLNISNEVNSFVWLDSNGNGQYDPGEILLSGVVVSLYSIDGTLICTDTTDINGQFGFSSSDCPLLVPGETYYINFPTSVLIGSTNIPLTAANSTSANENNDSDANVTTGNSNSFVLLAGNNVLPISAGFSGTAVAIAMTQVSATANCNNVVLNWATGSESGTSYFEVQRSESGSAWLTIGSVPAIGNSSTLHPYSFIDNFKVYDNAYYRIITHYTSGVVENGSVMVATSTCKDEVAISNIHPNPVQNQLSYDILSPINGLVTVEVIDVTGRVHYSERVNVISGINRMFVNTSALANAVYFIGIRSNNNTSNNFVKFVKSN